jgi:hypothetical protein
MVASFFAYDAGSWVVPASRSAMSTAMAWRMW